MCVFFSLNLWPCQEHKLACVVEDEAWNSGRLHTYLQAKKTLQQYCNSSGCQQCHLVLRGFPWYMNISASRDRMVPTTQQNHAYKGYSMRFCFPNIFLDLNISIEGIEAIGPEAEPLIRRRCPHERCRPCEVRRDRRVATPGGVLAVGDGFGRFLIKWVSNSKDVQYMILRCQDFKTIDKCVETYVYWCKSLHVAEESWSTAIL